MKRDFDLIRQILLRLEEEPSASARLFAQDFEQPETVNYHIWLLMQSGLIVGVCNHDYPRNGFMCICLTWQGQEFLAEVRDDVRWRKIRAVLAEKSLDLSLDAIKAAAAWVLKSMF